MNGKIYFADEIFNKLTYMNDKETELNRIIDIVVECCATQIDEAGTMSLSRSDVLGKSRCDNVVMTRCILVRMIAFAGYSTTTIAQLLRRTPQAVRHLMELGSQYNRQSRAYRIAEAEATLKCRDMI